MPDLPLRYAPGIPLTFTAGGTITGGDAVKISGNMTVIRTTAIGDTAIGQALFDAINTGLVGVGCSGPVGTFTATGAITAGDNVGPSGTAGQVATIAAAATPTAAEVNNNTRGRLGIALEGAANAGTLRVLMVQ